MEKERSLKERRASDYIPQVQTPHCHQSDVARVPDWGQSEAKPPADVEISTSLGWYPDFPPTPEPFVSCSPLFRVSYYMLPIPDYASLFRTILVSTGNYSSCLNIHLLLSCTLFFSDIAVFIRLYSGLHHLSLSFHRAPVSLIRLTGDSFFRLHHFA